MENEIIEKIEFMIGYTFTKKENLIKAVTHGSASNEKKEEYGNYEDLAKFGDRILNFIVIEELFRQNRIDDIETGHIKKNNYINNQNLMEKAKNIGIRPLREFLVLGKGSESDSNIDESDKIYGDVIEALIAAIYLDSEGNLDKLRKFILEKLNVLD